MSLLLNICKFNNCGFVFPNLNQLIQHIEREHINFDASYVEKLERARPAALPLSYVLPSNIELCENDDSDEELERPSSSAPTDSEQQNSTLVPLSDEASFISESADGNIEEEIDPDDTYTFDFIMRYGSKRSLDQFDEKPFICPMPGCTKRYKNVNGLRYHARNGHKKNIKSAKKYECYCGRGYKTAQGLRAHGMTHHQIALILPSSSSLPQSADTLSLLSFANMSNDSFDEIHDLNATKNRQEPKKEVTSVKTDIEAISDSAMGLTDQACLEVAVGIKHIKVEPNLNLECSSVDHMESISNFKPSEIENDDSLSNSSSSAYQGTSDVEEKTNNCEIGHVKSDSDDYEIDVGNANDTVYPYFN